MNALEEARDACEDVATPGKKSIEVLFLSVATAVLAVAEELHRMNERAELEIECQEMAEYHRQYQE